MKVILGVGEGIREGRNHKDMHRNKKVFSGNTKVRPETYLKENLVIWDLNGEEIQKRVDICIRTADLLCCTVENNTIL